MKISSEIEIKPVILLTQNIDNSIDFFDKNSKCQGLKLQLNKLKLSIEKCNENIEEIESFASEYDYDKDTPGNGYRSFIDIFNSAVRKVEKVCRQLTKNRGKILFQESYYADEINEWKEIFLALSTICASLIELHQNSDSSKNLYTMCDQFDSAIYQTLKSVNQKPFYGKNLGFQFCGSMRPVLKFVVVSMACYFSFYFKSKPKALKVLRFPISFVKHHTMGKKRAEKCINAHDKSTVKFCKSFWFLQEGAIIHSLSSMIAANVKINKLFEIQPEPLQVYSDVLGKLVDIPLPQSHIGLAPISCRLMSAQKRKGMSGAQSNSESSELSTNLIFHVHGGGFAAQTSKSHETYMRKWAVKLDVPILSIDYSLTPEAPFPRALEEVFYAYCWAMKNPELVGSTGENIIFVGDSAGGNLVTACVIKCIEMGIKIPKGLFTIYTVFTMNYSITPARFLHLMDPILPFKTIAHMVKNYSQELKTTDENDNNLIQFEKVEPKNRKGGKPRNVFKSVEEEFDVKFHDNYLISPYNAPDDILAQFPPTRILSSNLDPLLDDCIEFGKKLRKLNVKTSFEMVKGLPHGFLYFSQVSQECHDAVMQCAENMTVLLSKD